MSKRRKEKSILVVDDDEAILVGFKDILESEGYSVDKARTGGEAIEKSKAHFYNLALLDIRLPDMDGTELLVRLHGTVPKMMKVMVTGYPSMENAVESVNLRADAFIVKPVNPEELLKVVEEKLQEQEEAEKMTQDKVTEWIKTRINKLKAEKKTNRKS